MCTVAFVHVVSGLAQRLGGARAPGRWLVVIALVVAGSAFAQVDLGAADKLASGTVAYVLAVAAVVEAAVVAFLFRELRRESTGRLEDLARAYESAMRLQESGVKLSLQALEAVSVVERVVERIPTSQRG